MPLRILKELFILMLIWLLIKEISLSRKTLLTTAEYDTYIDMHPEDADFVAETGAEAIKQVLELD